MKDKNQGIPTDSLTNSNWQLAVITIALGAFIFNTSEFVPIGLLSLIANDFSINEAKAGFLISVYAWAVALTSLPLMLACSRFEMRRLLLAVVALFVLSHIGSALAEGYWTLMLARLGVACAHALFWSIAAPMAVRIAPKGKESLALGCIATGSSIALIAGLPLGRVIGLYLGWRISFLTIGILAFLLLLVLLKSLPTIPSAGAISARNLPKLLKTPQLLGVYGITLCLVSAHFIAYSYIEPFLAQYANFKENAVTMVLIVFGGVGFLGSFLFSKYYDKHKTFFVNCAIFGIFIALASLVGARFGLLNTLLICVLWGLCITLFNLTFQSQILNLVPMGTSVAMSMFSGIYNVGIGSGAFIGGIIIQYLGIANIGYVGAVIALCVCVYYRGWFVK
ncbi:sugar transporter [Helicobacter sp.]|uniref:sugar transporter n=1 Tax=Helicobacter sp. TaxID=218 RepID=UPI0019CD46BD|nr:sugar transporter [Helicobacter sp.]MBD5165411.1 sugar transporter [Helicobacter sp.]